MKKLFFLCLFQVLVIGKGHTQQQLTSNTLTWQSSLEEAQKISEQSGKPILINFTGNAWSEFSKKLNLEILSTTEFKQWVENKFVLLEADFPKDAAAANEKPVDEKIKKQNLGLAKFFKVTTFPTVWVFTMKIDKEKKTFVIDPICKIGYLKGGPKVFTDAIDKMILQQKKMDEEKKLASVKK